MMKKWVPRWMIVLGVCFIAAGATGEFETGVATILVGAVGSALLIHGLERMMREGR